MAKQTDPFGIEYSKLVGATITGICSDEGAEFGAGQPLYGVIVKHPDGRKQTAWIMTDPEGNGPGFLSIDDQ